MNIRKAYLNNTQCSKNQFVPKELHCKTVQQIKFTHAIDAAFYNGMHFNRMSITHAHRVASLACKGIP